MKRIKKLLMSVSFALITLCWGGVGYAIQYDPATRLADKLHQHDVRKNVAKKNRQVILKNHSDELKMNALMHKGYTGTGKKGVWK